MVARILITPLLFAAPLLSGSLSGCLRLSLQCGHLLLLLRLLLLPLLLETPCLLLSVRGVRLLISCYLLHHRRLCLPLLLHHLRYLLLSVPILPLAPRVIALPLFGGSDGNAVHLSLKLCHLRRVPLLALLLVALSSGLIVAPHPVLSFFLPPGLSLVPRPVLLPHPLFGLRGLLRHVLHPPPHLVVHLLLRQRLLLSDLAVFIH